MSVKLLSNLDFAAKLNSVEAVTESGKDFLKNYRGYMYQNPSSCGIVNGFMKESQNYGYDAGIMTIAKSISNFINENNISWKLATACESILNNNSTYNYIAKLGVSKVEKLLEMKESEVVQYIKGGCLKNVQYIPEFRNVCREVFQSTITESKTNKYTATTPISYVVVEGDVQYISVLGKTYKIEDNSISESEYDDPVFVKMNSILPNFEMVDESLTYSYKPNYTAEPYKFSINEDTISFTKGSISQTFESASEFRQYADAFSRQLFMAEKHNFLAICENIASVFENIGNVVYVDNAKVMECSDGTIMAIIESENNVCVDTARSIHFGKNTEFFESILEALNKVEKISGNDIRSLYESRIENEIRNSNNEEYDSIKEQLKAAQDEKISIRRKKIGLLAEQYKNDPIKIALLNNIAKELSILESESENE